MILNKIRFIYDSSLLLLTKKRGFKNDQEKSELSLLFLSVLLTSILMWGYSFTSYMYVKSDLLFKVGIVTSIAHILSPFIYFFLDRFLFPSIHLFLQGSFINLLGPIIQVLFVVQ